MAYRVEWSPRAVEDVEAIALYIAADSTAYARAVVKKIIDATRTLTRFPFAGRIVPEFGDENIREKFAHGTE
jgi:toxin ParE1/3/4